MDEHEAEEARDAADQQRKHEKENPVPARREEVRSTQTPEAAQEAEEASRHFDEAVERAKEQGAPSEEIIQEYTRGWEVTLKFKLPYLKTHIAQRVAAAALDELVQIDDSWDHRVDVQEWRR